MKKISIVTLALFAGVFAFAASVLAVEKTDGFVCPVFNENSAVGAHNPNAVQIGEGDYSIIGADVSVPIDATNADGSGVPGGSHSDPGDTDYTAIWAGN